MSINQNSYIQNDETYNNINYVGANTDLDVQTSLLDNMIFPVESTQDDINYIPENEIEQNIKDKDLRKQEVLSYYEGKKEKLNPLDTAIDIGKGAVEGLIDGAVVGSWFGLAWDEDTFNVFKTRSAAGDFAQTFTKYLTAGALAFSTGSWSGVALKTAAKLGGKNLLSKGLKNTSKFILHEKPFVLASKNPVSNVLFNKILNPRTVFSGMYADYMAYHPREGHLADILKQNGVENDLVNWLAGNADDTIAEAKAKNVVEGLFLTPFIGIATDVIMPSLWKSLKGTRNASLKMAKNPTKEAKEEFANELINLNKGLNQVSILEKAKQATEEAARKGTDPHKEIREIVPDFQLNDADTIIDNLQKGETITLKPDGTFSIKIEKWQDGYKVDENEFSRQFMSGYDEYKNPISSNRMNEAFKEILEQRGIVQLEDETTQSYFARIIDYYKSPNKWDIKEDIKLSFPENIKEGKKTRYGKTRAIRKNGELKNIEIQIKADAPNKLAILRAELEHVRDIAKGDIVDRPQGQEFARYKGKNEEEWQKTYLHKKAVSKAIREGKEIPPEVLQRYKELNKGKRYISYLKEDENKLPSKFSKEEQERIETFLNNELARALNIDVKEFKKLLTQSQNGKINASKKLQELIDIAKTGDYMASFDVKGHFQDLWDKIDAFSDIPLEEIGHNEDMLNKMLDALRKKDYLKPDPYYARSVEENNSIIDSHIQEKVLNKFYDELYDDVNKITADNIDEFEQLYKNKINQFETIPDYLKDEMRQEVDETLSFARKEIEKQKSIKKVDNTIKELDKAETIEQTEIKINELVETTELETPQSAKKLVNSFAKNLETRDYKTTIGEIENIYEYTRKHLTDEVLSKNDISSVLNNNGADILRISNEIVAYEKIQNNIKELISDCNKRLSENPNAFEEYAKIKTLRNNYTYLEDILINQRSLFGDAFDKLKLGYSKENNSFDKIYTKGERKQKDEFVKNLSETLNEIYEEFYTLNDIPDFHKLAKKVIDKLENKYGKIDNNTINFQNLEAFVKYLDREIKNNPSQKRNSVINEAVKLYSEADELLLFAQGATMAANTTGFSTFKKYFASNLAHNYIGSILSSPATQITNALSGMFNIFLEDSMKFITGLRTGNSELMEDVILSAKGYSKYFGESLHWAAKVFQDEKGILANTRRYGIELSPFEALSNKNEIKPLSAASFGLDENNPYSRIVDTMGGVLRLSSRVMGSVDECLTQLKYRSEAFKDAYKTAQSQLGANASLDEIDILAEELFRESGRYFTDSGNAVRSDMLYNARKLLYQNNLDRKIFDTQTFSYQQMEDTTAISEIGSAISQIRNLHPGFRFIFPFVNTPFNIIEQMIEYTPMTMLTNKYKNLKGIEKQIADTKIIFGSATIVLTAAMAMDGKITGSAPTDPAERKALTQSGWQPYSFVVTEPDGSKTYISYKRIEPLASILGLGVDSTNLVNEFKMSDSDISKTSAMLGMMILNNALDKSYTSQSIDTLALLTIANEQDVKKLQRVIGNFAAGNIPFSAFANWYKNDGVVKEMSTFLDIVRQRSPFVSNEGIMPNRNYFGEVRNTSLRGKGLITRETYQKNDSADKEILRLAKLGFEPYRPSKQLGDSELDMTTFMAENKQTAYDKVLEEMGTITINGKTLREAINNLVGSSRYDNLPDGILEDEDQFYKSKKREINKLIKKYADKAKQNVLNSGEFINEDAIDLKTMQKNWKKSKRLSRVIDINNELNQIL